MVRHPFFCLVGFSAKKMLKVFFFIVLFSDEEEGSEVA